MGGDVILNFKEKELALRLYKEGKPWSQIYKSLPDHNHNEIRGYIRHTKEYINRHSYQTNTNNKTDLDEQIKKRVLCSKEISIEDVSNEFDVGIQHIKDVIAKLTTEGYLIHLSESKISLASDIAPPEPVKINIEPFYQHWIKFGVVSDTHLNSKYERLDVLNALYDIFEREGIKNVFHAGNIIDGYSKLNMFDVFNTGVDEQVNYCIEKYPKRKDMITHFISADDHEGWFVQREHINIGKVIEDSAIEKGRHDLHHLGYIEADVRISVGQRDTILRIFHPGGGTAYAISYVPQKIIESLQGGDKPDFYIIGHTHKREFSGVRNVPYIQAGCTQDQTRFMRKKRLEAHIGGWIIELGISEEGNIYRIKQEWFNFYNKDFYKNEIVSLEKIDRNWTYKW